MLKALLQFEWYYHRRKPSFYFILLAFLIIGYLIGLSGGILFPNVYGNAPYTLTYLVSILSLLCIFSVTLMVAQSALRERETKFDALIYATPVQKFPYLFSRVTILTIISVISFSLSIAGLFIGQYSGGLPDDKTGPYKLLFYLYPLLLIAIPNILLCVAILYSTAWATKNKLIIYIAGLCIYIFYLVGSIFSNLSLFSTYFFLENCRNKS